MSVSLMAQTTYKVDLAPFPKPEKDKSKLLLRFHILKTMETRRLKFCWKTMETDGCNKTFLSGEFKSSELKGWGYDYLTFTTNGSTPSTLMACPGAKPKWSL